MIDKFSSEFHWDVVHTTRKLLDVGEDNETAGFGHFLSIDAITGKTGALELIVVAIGEAVRKLQQLGIQLEGLQVITRTLLIETIRINNHLIV